LIKQNACQRTTPCGKVNNATVWCGGKRRAQKKTWLHKDCAARFYEGMAG